VSICVRAGVQYNRHKWVKQTALADVEACEHCSRVKGSVFNESGDQEGPAAPTSVGDARGVVPAMLQTDGLVRVPTSDDGDVGAIEGVSEVATA
jgi:hypothetical protein